VSNYCMILMRYRAKFKQIMADINVYCALAFFTRCPNEVRRNP
jgi:hypothetical protein